MDLFFDSNYCCCHCLPPGTKSPCRVLLVPDPLRAFHDLPTPNDLTGHNRANLQQIALKLPQALRLPHPIPTIVVTPPLVLAGRDRSIQSVPISTIGHSPSPQTRPRPTNYKPLKVKKAPDDNDSDTTVVEGAPELQIPMGLTAGQDYY